ncbi:MAG: iron-containing alcohol dehydrogenase [Phycisphaerae bacterium]|nr:iron-containing alcohol dehydrogenase [Phycisphaerae bacterium]
MFSFQYHSPVQICFGYGARDTLGEVAGRLGGKGFLVVDPGVASSPLFKAYIESQTALLAGCFDKVEPNPSVGCVSRIAAQIRSTGAGFVVALGGGSTIDAAKAAALSAGGSPIEEYHSGRRPAGENALPVIAMPTTAGTGSEVTAVSVLTDPARGVKAPIGGPALLPRVAIVDPEWTVSVPPTVTAATGMDALSHALEAYWGVHAQPICDALAEKAAWLILDSLEQAYANGSDRDAREKVALGSLLAGLAFAAPKTAAVHACSFPLTQRFRLPHGVACALTLDRFLEYNTLALPEKLAHLARQLGLEGVPALAARIRTMKRNMSLPTTLADVGIHEQNLPALVAESFHPNMRNNPREVTPADLMAIYSSLQETH